MFSNDISEDYYELKFDNEIEVNNIEDTFLDEKVYKVNRVLANKEKSLLYFYYGEYLKDKDIMKNVKI